jgi:SAM-dependent methyltransferase
MPSSAEHYRDVLADVYSWMLGGFDAGIRKNVAFFERHDVRPRGSGRAVDLGAGCGFQAIPLARAGFDVTAIDLDRSLLDELERHRGEAPVATVADDLMRFDAHVDAAVEIVVCMTDTLLHLEGMAQVDALFAKVFAALEPGGRFITTFRDLSAPAEGLDRFIPVQSDDTAILTCFLEYEPDSVKVHDLLYRQQDGRWQFSKSYYRKLRLSADNVRERLTATGFDDVRQTAENGLVTVIAARS